MVVVRVLRESSEDEMIACFLQGELPSCRSGPAIRKEIEAAGHSEQLVTRPNLADEHGNRARREILAAARAYGQDRELFRHFPSRVRWVWARLTPRELARVRYIFPPLILA